MQRRYQLLYTCAAKMRKLTSFHSIFLSAVQMASDFIMFNSICSLHWRTCALPWTTLPWGRCRGRSRKWGPILHTEYSRPRPVILGISGGYFSTVFHQLYYCHGEEFRTKLTVPRCLWTVWKRKDIGNFSPSSALQNPFILLNPARSTHRNYQEPNKNNGS